MASQPRARLDNSLLVMLRLGTMRKIIAEIQNLWDCNSATGVRYQDQVKKTLIF